eukprot:Unigene11303_Nuclearia_a/m.34536 Unigene11303_Nuclearia_a/g.34536  ORF Unigene11303_Nuclearia_a/g.34536 Unigene11303_Nuclearia_a/m.34536 type:complete len:309 (-) Unigene11303_Nuclearia_a:367-1293(-)
MRRRAARVRGSTAQRARAAAACVRAPAGRAAAQGALLCAGVVPAAAAACDVARHSRALRRLVRARDADARAGRRRAAVCVCPGRACAADGRPPCRRHTRRGGVHQRARLPPVPEPAGRTGHDGVRAHLLPPVPGQSDGPQRALPSLSYADRPARDRAGPRRHGRRPGAHVLCARLRRPPRGHALRRCARDDRRADLCVRARVPARSLPAAHLRASLQADDAALPGDGAAALWHVPADGHGHVRRRRRHARHPRRAGAAQRQPARGHDRHAALPRARARRAGPLQHCQHCVHRRRGRRRPAGRARRDES